MSTVLGKLENSVATEYYGSDFILDFLIENNVKFVAYNPGSTFRGFHESIVTSKDPKVPKFILCCHEEIAVAIAHGYAKASGECMAVFLHGNIGVQHASMAIYNAWCDRVPILILGGIGPMQVKKRRPWIDWVHTSNYNADIIDPFVKWHDQPHSIECLPHSLAKAYGIANVDPKAPVYVAIDSTFQEGRSKRMIVPRVEKYFLKSFSNVNNFSLSDICEKLFYSKFPVVIVDRIGKNIESVSLLEKIVNLLSLPVIDYGGRFNFPNIHSLVVTGAEEEIFRQADFILAFDMQDILVLEEASENGSEIVHVTMDDYLISKWSCDYQGFLFDVKTILADSYAFISSIYTYCLDRIGEFSKKIKKERYDLFSKKHKELREKWKDFSRCEVSKDRLTLPAIIYEIWNIIKDEDWSLLSFSGVSAGLWARRLWDFSEPGRYFGFSGGAGLGYGLGASIGAGLHCMKEKRVLINLQTDGDFLFTPSALWTVSHYRIPILIIVLDNNSYNNTKEHLDEVISFRKRPSSIVECGSKIDNPSVNYPLLANSFDIFSIGPVNEIGKLYDALSQAVEKVKSGNPVLVSVKVHEN